MTRLEWGGVGVHSFQCNHLASALKPSMKIEVGPEHPLPPGRVVQVTWLRWFLVGTRLDRYLSLNDNRP